MFVALLCSRDRAAGTLQSTFCCFVILVGAFNYVVAFVHLPYGLAHVSGICYWVSFVTQVDTWYAGLGIAYGAY
jgi:hypothetical protein